MFSLRICCSIVVVFKNIIQASESAVTTCLDGNPPKKNQTQNLKNLKLSADTAIVM